MAAGSKHLRGRYTAADERLPPQYHRYVNVMDSGDIIVSGPARQYIRAYARKTVVRPPRRVALTKNKRKRLIVHKGICQRQRQPVALNRMVF